jgi:hypothetical protein
MAGNDDVMLTIGGDLKELKKDLKKASKLTKEEERKREFEAINHAKRISDRIRRRKIQDARRNERLEKSSGQKTAREKLSTEKRVNDGIRNLRMQEARRREQMEKRLSRRLARNRLRTYKNRLREETRLQKRAQRRRGRIIRGVGVGLGGVAAGGIFGAVAQVRRILQFDVKLASLASQAKITPKEQFRLRDSMTDTAIAIGVQRDVILDSVSRIYEKSGEYKFAADNIEKLAKVIRGTQVEPMALGETLAAMAFAFKGVKWDGKNVPIFDLLEILISQGDEASVTIRDLASNGEELMGAFKIAGLTSLKSFKEFFALVQIAGGGGTSSEAATFVKNFIIQITKRGDKIEKMLGDKLQYPILKPGGGIRDVEGVVKDILQATGGDVEKILELVPRFRGAMPLTLMAGEFFREGTTKQFDHLIKLGDAMGTIERRYKRVAETPSQGFERFVATVTKLSDVALVDTLSHISDSIERFVDDPDKLQDMARSFKEIGDAILFTAKAVGLLAKAGGIITDPFMSLIPGHGSLNKKLRKLPELKGLSAEKKTRALKGTFFRSLLPGGTKRQIRKNLAGMELKIETIVVMDPAGNIKKQDESITMLTNPERN